MTDSTPSLSAPAADDRDACARHLAFHLQQAQALRLKAGTDPAWQSERAHLRRWQSARLERTYADLLASERYHAGARFFLDELYGGGDLAERDDEIARVVPKLVKLLPDSGLRVVALAVELDALSETLDAAMVEQLQHSGGTAALSARRWAEAYRGGNNRAAREHQLQLVAEVGQALDQLTRKPLIGMTLRMMQGPAALAGFASLHAFLERGYQSFRQMRGADEFLATIVAREQRILQATQDGDDSLLLADAD